MLTALLIGFPLLAALLVFFVRGNAARNLALGFSIIEFVISIVALLQFKSNPDAASLKVDWTWVQSMGIHFSAGIDGLSILMVLLTTFLVPLIILSSFKNTYSNAHNFYGLMLIMQMALVGEIGRAHV